MASDEIILKEGKYIRFVKRDEWEYITRHNCSAIVIILAMTDGGDVIFVEQYRPPVRSKVIEFPAGLIGDREGSEDESIANGAKRELLEETGYEAQEVTPLLTGPVAGGASADLVTIVQATGLTKVGDGGGDTTEDIIVHEVPLGECNAWLAAQAEKGLMIEPKIYTGLYFLNKYNTVA